MTASRVVRQEYYYSSWLDERRVIALTEHVREFLRGCRSVPVAKAPAPGSRHVFFTFAVPLLGCFLKRRNPLLTPYLAALSYGFRGHSRGGRSGIFYQRKEDTRLRVATERLVRANAFDVEFDLCVTPADFPTLKPVKIVWPESSGRRVVGVYNEGNGRMIFVGFASYGPRR